MNSVKKNENQKDIERYLEEKNVYFLFEELLQSIIINQPKSPLDFLFDKLSQPEHKKVFIIGPTGSNARELALELSDHLKITCVSVGDLLKKEISKKTPLGQEIENSIRNFSNVRDEIVIEIVIKHLEQLEKENKSYILEGFPKTKQQGLTLQKAGIIPNTFIILTMSDQKIYDSCVQKINQEWDIFGDAEPWNFRHIPEENREEIARNHAQEYKLHLDHLFQIYKNYIYKVDAESGKEEILEDVVRLIKYKNHSKNPKHPQQIIIMGPPSSGRTTLARDLCAKYGFVHISTVAILREFINKKGKLSAMVEECMKKGDLIPDEIIVTLLNERLSKKDCIIQGFVLDGFPKNLSQIQSLEDLRVQPNFIFVLEGNEEALIERIQDGKNNETLAPRIIRWKEVLKIFESTPKYSNLIFKINFLCESKNIVEKVSFHLENS